MKDIDTRALMGEAKFYEGYSRWSDDLGRYETWEESVTRVMNMHREYYKDKMNDKLALLINEAEALYKDKYVLGAQRALQFGGEQILKHQMRMYNCGAVETTFVTDTGLKSFADYNDGDFVTVKTPQGNWKQATVKSYGKQQLNRITFSRNGGQKHTVRFTPDHRWLLKDGSVTTNLMVGDSLYHTVNTFNDFEFDDAEPDEKLYWAYGYVFGDGTVNKTHSMVRLCGKDVGYEYRFKELGFKTSSSLSLDGDVIAYTGKYKKTLPDVDQDDSRLIRAFVRGYLDADGEKVDSRFDCPQFKGIQTSDKEAAEFIRKAFPIAGIYPASEVDLTGTATPYTESRGYTVRFGFTAVTDSKYAASWKVVNIEEDAVETVWCLEVKDDHAFVMEKGVPTGNCTSSYADRPAFFGELFYVLLCGAGAGFSVQTHHVAKLPAISQRKGQAKIHVVDDSIEGWSQALDVLMSSFFVGGGKHPEYEGRRVYFDLNQIRPKGALISGGFKAPGPEPLRKALDKIEHLIQGVVLDGRTALAPIEVYDICMHAADAVLAGGVRRSATICLFSPDDDAMIKAKTGNWFKDNPQRGRSNNSAVIVRSEADRDQFATMMKSIREFGEPGFIFTESTEHTYNPCVEIGKLPVWIDPETEDRVSGWQGCNLSEINGAKCTTLDEFLKACRAGAIMGTLQAGYTDFKFLDETSKKIFDREALIGVSITGWMNSPDVLFDEENLKQGAELVKTVNKEMAALIGINPAARTTCVKPSGNASVLLGTSSGIHGDHSPRYLRNMQMNKEQEVAQLIAATNPYMVEDSVWSASGTDFVISFPVLAPEGSLFKRDLYGIKLLEKVKLVQNSWIEAGTDVDLCVDPTLRHNVSNTVQVPATQWEEVEQYLFDNRDSFAGISFIAASGDKDFNQAPFTEVLTEQQLIDRYGAAALFASGLIVEASKGFNDLWQAIHAAQGLLNQQLGEQKDMGAEWTRRFRNFARNYFDGDMKMAEYCLKDVYLLHKWTKIQQNMQPVDFEHQLSEKQYTDIDTTGAASCYGGACEI